MSRIVGFCLAAVIATGLGSAPATAGSLNPFKAVSVYGDSLVDDGNTYRLTVETLPPSPPYYEGRFSNGPVWAEYITGDFEARGKPAGNYGFAGAHALPGNGDVPGLGLQIGLSTPQLLATRDLNSVAMMLIGSNDIIATADAGGDTEAAGAAAATAVFGGALALYGLGVDHVLFVNLPPIGETPRYTMADPALAEQVAEGAAAFNATLTRLLPALDVAGRSYGLFDLDGLLLDAIANPATYGFTNVADPCLTLGPGGFAVCDTPGSFLFWDGIHPTAAAHQQIAALVGAELAPVPLPAPAALLLGGLAAALAVGRRRPGRAA